MSIYDGLPCYDATSGVFRARVFADGYQFFLCDTSFDPFQAAPEIDQSAISGGWLKSSEAVFVLTVADAHDHRVDFQIAEKFSASPAAERLFSTSIRVPSGVLSVYDELLLRISAGTYDLHCEAFNLGAENTDSAAMEDAEFLLHDEWERYVVTLVPIAT